MRLIDALAGAAIALAVSVQPGCSTPGDPMPPWQKQWLRNRGYQVDRLGCEVGPFDPAPDHCWCEDPADVSCLRAADAQTRYRKAEIAYDQHSHFHPSRGSGGLTTPGAPHPSAEITLDAQGRDWRDAPGYPSVFGSGDRRIMTELEAERICRGYNPPGASDRHIALCVSNYMPGSGGGAL